MKAQLIKGGKVLLLAAPPWITAMGVEAYYDIHGALVWWIALVINLASLSGGLIAIYFEPAGSES